MLSKAPYRTSKSLSLIERSEDYATAHSKKAHNSTKLARKCGCEQPLIGNNYSLEHSVFSGYSKSVYVIIES